MQTVTCNRGHSDMACPACCARSRAFIRAAADDDELPVPSPTFLLQNIYNDHAGAAGNGGGSNCLACLLARSQTYVTAARPAAAGRVPAWPAHGRLPVKACTARDLRPDMAPPPPLQARPSTTLTCTAWLRGTTWPASTSPPPSPRCVCGWVGL